MNWLHLEEVLREYEAYLLEASRNNMPSHYKLRDRIKFNLQVGDNFYEIIFTAPEYWKWVENGHRTRASGITKKKIAPYSNKSEKLPSTNQLAIANDGKIGGGRTNGIHFLEKSVTEAENYFVSKISDAITEDIKENLNFLIVL